MFVNASPNHDIYYIIVKICRTMNKIFGKKVGVNQMMHTYLTDKYGDTINKQKQTCMCTVLITPFLKTVFDCFFQSLTCVQVENMSLRSQLDKYQSIFNIQDGAAQVTWSSYF